MKISKNCKTCGWGRQTKETKALMICGCRLSGSFETHVIEYETCNRWKKATDEYLKMIGEIR